MSYFFLSLSKLNSLNGSLWCNGFSIQFQNIFLPAFYPSKSCPPPAHIILLHVTSLFSPSKWTIEIYGNDFNKQFDVKLFLSFKIVSPTVFPRNRNNLGVTLYFSVHKGGRQNFKLPTCPLRSKPVALAPASDTNTVPPKGPGNSSASKVWGVNIHRTTVTRIASMWTL